ncbi:MAG: MBL fold metallo-hydrolase [Clostridiaceae bacterium]|nr:MBL fold metallo-hydrolase [Clostridiaceae bacterium]
MPIKVYHDIYRNEIQLPKNPLKVLNSYIILGEDRNLIIDTGFNSEECKASFMAGLKELDVDLSKTDLFITHLHADHSGLAATLNKEGMTVYTSKKDGEMINEMSSEAYWEKFESYKKIFDLEKDHVSFDDHPGYKYCTKEPIAFTALQEGDILQIGDYSFDVVDIPGHTPGQIGLYEGKHKLFFCGDHILDRITPNIAFWEFDEDSLGTYFKSLKKVKQYEVEHLFTAHREPVKDYRRRVEELYEHHQKRLKEIIGVMESGKETVRDIAANMHWELRYDRWEDFPNPQKWFAAGEAMSHLEHLVFSGKAEKTYRKETLHYKLIV